MEVILNCRGIQDYRDEPVSEQDQRLILEVVRQTSSGKNAQAWRRISLPFGQTRVRTGD